ncbi:UDP-glucose 4-epimerase [Aggregatibacter actinomycetemcomitans serotype e str. SC1083]|uniref:UDP-glucose 4-epimerase n=1 Tax=Aggregatibacter actinomycetemcomitans serotype e str. SC1083 TaxID=907488 RepID=G4A7A6_AGGAC|nr:UDP-glucose 4-epimerase GalE [Aggregatibacter actinomycetemcomitans]EGY34310.1 UDP-glucose 4-epimerase [Aggregatibacter actinomycetemcomitans serotype e str. SC1083]KYK72647.1 UDP-galactose-4-epimerase [Aggregatibacter actinomycetemcomitans serotype e str. SA3096]KYK78551.1 UDP-galactose-4-epimerase [Aggregatibacter actinomycetemcomitans serotype e str. SC936]KYK93987.1 UDP-galactose-4-epimerase [Aggregatibacter actinomycetemcomitans serotype e str. ANH9776]TYB22247.1 UDP-glucose 4-epimeras
MTILVTGGAGYVGSHTVVELFNTGKEVVVLDNLCNASPKSLERVEQLTGKKVKFYLGDVLDRALLQQIFAENKIDSVIHFAGLKAVGESVQKPAEYYLNNITGSLVLVQEMKKAGVWNFVFSSSATVYGDPKVIPITEDCEVGGTTNPYGTSKYMVEQILRDIAKAEPKFSMTILRYFNPVGAHASGLMGEDPNGIPNNLLPYISQVAIGKLPQLSVFGSDYDTHDGTGVRDYIHVVDLAIGHVKALDRHQDDAGLHIYNLGTGVGYSVLDMVKAFEQANDIQIPYKLVDRRPGDIATCYSDPSLAAKELNWKAERSLTEMMKDTWNWQKNNPKGYRD